MTYLPGSLYSYQTVTTTPTPLQVANRVAYVCKGSSLLTFILPPTAIAGFSFKIIGKNCLWKITQQASQFITLGITTTTTGSTGALASKTVTDKVEVACLTANFEWDVADSFGNIDIT